MVNWSGEVGNVACFIPHRKPTPILDTACDYTELGSIHEKCCSLLHCVVVFANEYPLAIVSHFSRVCRQPCKVKLFPDLCRGVRKRNAQRE